MPNFLIIGAAKSGTTSLWHYLKQHPQIYMSAVKEPRFFAFEGDAMDYVGPRVERHIRGTITTLDAYRALFAQVADQKAIGEASTVYLDSDKAVERIHHYIPNAKLIAILRHPVERAYSAFLFKISRGEEPLRDFKRALEEEERGMRQKWWVGLRYKSRGFYYQFLKLYAEAFGREQLQVHLYEDLKADPAGVVAKIFRFLDVDEQAKVNVSGKFNVTRLPRNALWHGLLTKPNPVRGLFKHLIPMSLRDGAKRQLVNANMHKPALAPEVRQALTDAYREDILQLQDLIGRDLSHWLEIK